MIDHVRRKLDQKRKLRCASEKEDSIIHTDRHRTRLRRALEKKEAL